MRKSENYGDAGFLDELPRLIDFIPTRLPVVLLLFVIGLGAIAGLEALYFSMPTSIMAVDRRVEAFDLSGQSNMAVWFSSMALASAGALALVVYSIRRYRSDDYHGHYRVWLWTSLCCFLLSMDQTANLRAGFAQMAMRLTGTPLYGDGSLWWVIAYGFLLGAVGTRLLLDLFPSRLSTAALLVAVASYGLCAACGFGFVSIEGGEVRQVMVSMGSRVLGNFMILAAIGFHARYVLLDAEGLLPRRRQKPEEAAKDLDEAEESEAVSMAGAASGTLGSGRDQSIVVHPPHGVPRPAGTLGVAPSVPQPTPPKTVAGVEASLKRRLTKQERKALRQRLQQMQAERQKWAG